MKVGCSSLHAFFSSLPSLLLFVFVCAFLRTAGCESSDICDLMEMVCKLHMLCCSIIYHVFLVNMHVVFIFKFCLGICWNRSYLLEEWKEKRKETTEDIVSKFSNLRFLSLEVHFGFLGWIPVEFYLTC